MHSKYSRAVSPEMVLPTMALWAEKKGIDLLTTADWTHPLWLKEIETQLEEDGEGIYKLKNPPAGGKTKFILTTEIANIFTQGGKGRRIHTLFFAPNFEVVHKINEAIAKRGGNLMSDGRPILGLSVEQMCELVWEIDEKVLVVPAHCLPGEEKIITNKGLVAIRNVEEKNQVLTHKGRYRRVSGLFKREYSGDLYKVIPWCFSQGLSTTPEHPYLAIKTVKKCRSTGDICRPFGKHLNHCQVKHYLSYKPEWLAADKLQVGDLLLYPILLDNSRLTSFKISDVINGLEKRTSQVRIKGGRGLWTNNKIKFDADFGRLIGYYLAEGSIYGKNGLGFCFNKSEKELVKDAKRIISKIFGINKYREYYRKGSGGVELSFSSEILTRLFKKWFYGELGSNKASNKKIPNWMLSLNSKFQAEILIGWWLGDKGYTVSRELMNQMKIICLRLGIIPSIGLEKIDDHHKRGKHLINNREIKANYDLYYFNCLSFITAESKKLVTRMNGKRLSRKLDRHHGWIDDNYAYLPIRKIEKKQFKGKVYNLEVEKDNSYAAEFAAVHNCWTPWFAVFGSKSGFDSIEECFGKYADRIYSAETGLSSDVLMNWKIKDLDTRTIISNSDSHSPRKMGREATVFEFNGDKLKYDDIAGAIKQDKTSRAKIAYTIEFHPEEGKYHYTGHRACGVVQSPEETRAKGATCHVCGRALTVGVEHRVDELSAKERLEMKAVEKINENGVKGYFHPYDKTRPPYVMLVPLQEIIAEAFNVGSGSKKVDELYETMGQNLGKELDILLKAKLEAIEKISGAKAAEGIRLVRSGEIVVQPGYDGEFGVVKIWDSPAGENSDTVKTEQTSLF